jgi:sulfhydrogenase subunit gamma (sulfur reductase)
MNSYEPIAMRIERVITETSDGSLKSFELMFERDSDRKQFFKQYHPGQFCQLSIFGKGEAPFGVASAAWEGDFVRFTIQKVGSFTRFMHTMQAGDKIGMRGPLGNGFPIDEWKGMDLVVIGGGCAFSSLYAMTKHVMHPDQRKNYKRIIVIYGARTSGLCMYKPDIEHWHERDDIEVHQAIDVPEEGWKFHVGFVPAVTKQVSPNPKNTVAVLCGPPVMIKYTLPILTELGFPPQRIYTSVEKRMKCGIGKCGRCNIGPKYICKDGPVFTLQELQVLPNEL